MSESHVTSITPSCPWSIHPGQRAFIRHEEIYQPATLGAAGLFAIWADGSLPCDSSSRNDL